MVNTFLVYPFRHDDHIFGNEATRSFSVLKLKIVNKVGDTVFEAFLVKLVLFGEIFLLSCHIFPIQIEADLLIAQNCEQIVGAEQVDKFFANIRLYKVDIDRIEAFFDVDFGEIPLFHWITNV